MNKIKQTIQLLNNISFNPKPKTGDNIIDRQPTFKTTIPDNQPPINTWFQYIDKQTLNK